MSRPLNARRTHGVDKNVWVEFTQLAADYKPVNLGQGFPDFSPPPFIQEAFCKAVSGGPSMHQYTRAFVSVFIHIGGHKPLYMKAFFNPIKQKVAEVGAYQALFSACQAVVDDGDEVIVVEPFFDCYKPMVLMAGGTPVYVPLRPVFKTEELQMIADLCIKHNLLCISDEVYEWLTYDGAEHVKIASLPGMWERTITIGSAGKTFSATGWKVGWAIGSRHVMKYIKTIHQNTVYHCATAAQEAVAHGFDREYELFGTPESYFQQLPALLQQKRKRLALCLESVGLKPIMPEGGYFIMADISSFNDENTKDEPYDFRFVKWLIKEKGLATIPVSAFYSSEHSKDFEKYIRFCFVKVIST
uniref:Kynurenine aminotransferase 1 n=1 Tax=Cynoglossus semilaevis TaxID=244447 RepID=A0A3P8W8I7_CYNSE